MSNKNRLMGLRFYIGNTYVNGVWFDGFQNISSEEVAGAFSWEPQAAARDVNAVINIKFGFEDVSNTSTVLAQHFLFSSKYTVDLVNR